MPVEEMSLLDLLLVLILIAVVGSVCTLVITSYNFLVNVFEVFAGVRLENILPDVFPIYAVIISVLASVIVFSIFMKVGRALRRV